MHQFHSEQSPLTQSEQQEILALAAEMQRRDAQAQTLADLEQAGVTLGIDPRYIRAAAAQRHSDLAPAPTFDRRAMTTALALFGIYTVVALRAIVSIGQYRPAVYVFAAFAGAVVLGLAMPGGRKWRIATMVYPVALGVSALVLRAFGLHYFVHFYDYLRGEYTNLFALVILQSLVAGAVHLFMDRIAQSRQHHPSY